MRLFGVRIHHPIIVSGAGRVSGLLLRALFRTVRMEVHADAVNPYRLTESELKRTDRYIFSVWHDAAVVASFGGPKKRMVALTSKHRDGAFGASALASAGVQCVRGSTGKNGLRAARELMRVARERDIVVTPDGPRGPRRKLSRGIVYLASKTGNPIVPAGYACSDPWDIRGSWTSMTVPKPFSRVVSIVGKPIPIAPRLSEEEISHQVSVVQQLMDRVQQAALTQLKSAAQPSQRDADRKSPSKRIRKAA